MKKMPMIATVVAGVSLVLGIIARLTETRSLFELTSRALLNFTDTALLFAIVFALLQLLQAKKEK